MFDAKKLLDALGTPAGTPAPEKPAAETGEKKTDAKPAANPLGAGTLLSDLIGIANQPSPPPLSSEKTEGEAPPPKPAKAAPPTDLTDLVLNKAQDYLRSPQGNAAMNALVLGVTKAVANSEAGRKLAASAKTKGTALFNRFMNKSGGPPIIDATLQPVLTAPVQLSPPETPQSGETALLIVRAMIAAAAADGVIDEGERARILGALKMAGIDGEGVHLIEAELAHPASVADLALAAKTPEMALQAYMAARRVITPNAIEERVFLAHLAGALKLDPRVVAQIDAGS
ncbi:tellurite resistance TerB family protein [Microvirga sp. 2MCAF38]|uniref:tellurite resistance TerB family protein n=1 Tax=Microvirga sp. 2MCAF38 TaxID=3232989 RepID=UPI003F965869